MPTPPTGPGMITREVNAGHLSAEAYRLLEPSARYVALKLFPKLRKDPHSLLDEVVVPVLRDQRKPFANRTEFKAVVKRKMRYRCLSLLRKCPPPDQLPEGHDAPGGPPPFDDLSLEEAYASIERALGARRAQVTRLLAAGYDTKGIAELLGCGVRTVQLDLKAVRKWIEAGT